MAFPIKPKYRSGASGNPTSLNLAELAVNTFDGSLYLGADAGVMLLNGPVAAGTVVTEHTGNGTSTAFTFDGYNGTADGGYLVSVGGIDQPPSMYSISNTAGGTITFGTAPVNGELISIRAIVAGSGGGGDGNATQLQGRDIASTAPTNGQVLGWNSTTSKWEPIGVSGGTITYSTPGTYYWRAPITGGIVVLNATGGTGGNGGYGGGIAAGDSGQGGQGGDGGDGSNITAFGNTIAGGLGGKGGGGGGSGGYDATSGSGAYGGGGATQFSSGNQGGNGLGGAGGVGSNFSGGAGGSDGSYNSGGGGGVTIDPFGNGQGGEGGAGRAGATLETYFQTTANTLYAITISEPGTGTSGSTGQGLGTNGNQGNDGASGTITLTW